jgi:hypothetical protein
MTEEIARLEHPIDAMYFIHKALRAEAVRTEKQVQDLEVGTSLQPFKLAFSSWATALVFHAEMEVGTGLAGAETSRGEDGGSDLGTQITSAILTQEDEEHKELLEKLQDVLTVLDEDIGPSSMIIRTKQHLYQQVVALRIAQEDHLETEEALVLPMVRERLNVRRQLEAAKGLLIDEQAQDPRWMIDWVSRELNPQEQRLLADLEARFDGLSSSAG